MWCRYSNFFQCCNSRACSTAAGRAVSSRRHCYWTRTAPRSVRALRTTAPLFLKQHWMTWNTSFKLVTLLKAFGWMERNWGLAEQSSFFNLRSGVKVLPSICSSWSSMDIFSSSRPESPMKEAACSVRMALAFRLSLINVKAFWNAVGTSVSWLPWRSRKRSLPLENKPSGKDFIWVSAKLSSWNAATNNQRIYYNNKKKSSNLIQSNFKSV